MAKIFYGVAGEGFGHSSRCHVLGQSLIDAGHDVRFGASRKSKSYLQEYFGHVIEVPPMSLVYDRGKLRPWRTACENAKSFIRAGEGYKFQIDEFAPDLVISDFEPYSAWYAWLRKIPYISVDNEHALTHMKLGLKFGEILPWLNAWLVTRCYYFGASAYVVLNFFKAPLKSGIVIPVPPVIRPIVMEQDTTQREQIVVYSTDLTGKVGLVESLNHIAKQRFHIYGFNIEEQAGNCYFKKTSTRDFLADLASSSGVISTAGFSLISEALYLRKPMLLVPVQGQYEQMTNARYAEKFGAGIYSSQLTDEALERFVNFTHKPLNYSEEIVMPDNAKCIEILKNVIEKVLNV